MSKDKIRRCVEKYFEKACELGDYLTAHPEISGEESGSCQYITEFLKTQGYEVTTPYVGMTYSFLAVDKNRVNETGKKAAFLCEYDALPDVGHACGHSYSCAISVLAALALREAFPQSRFGWI